MVRSRIICFEGAYFTGKSIQLDLLSELLTKNNIKNDSIKFPLTDIIPFRQFFNISFNKPLLDEEIILLHKFIAYSYFEAISKLKKKIDSKDRFILVENGYCYNIISMLVNKIKTDDIFEIEKVNISKLSPDLINICNVYNNKYFDYSKIFDYLENKTPAPDLNVDTYNIIKTKKYVSMMNTTLFRHIIPNYDFNFRFNYVKLRDTIHDIIKENIRWYSSLYEVLINLYSLFNYKREEIAHVVYLNNHDIELYATAIEKNHFKVVEGFNKIYSMDLKPYKIEEIREIIRI